MPVHKTRPLWYALCFAVPALVAAAAYAAEGFAPFGDKSILAYDMAQQYAEFFCALKNGDLFFSWSKALGTSYIGVFSYYVSSPLSLLTLLVPNEAMPLGLMWLTVLKLGLAGLTFAIFSSHYFRRINAVTLLGAVSYALCAYCAAYSMCIMWLDGVIWLPILLLGLERLMAGQDRRLFSISLAVCFFSTWYISYMIGGFCCLWFLFRAFVRRLSRPELLRRLRDFLLAALWALCLTAWLWLPSLLAMFSGKFTIASYDYSGLFTFQPADLPAQFLPGRFQHFNSDLPLIFCGTLTVPACIAYFFLCSIPLRERLAAASLTLVLLLSLWLSPLDKVWHLFQYPNSFHYRYSFLLSFLLVFLAGHALHRGSDLLGHRLPHLACPAALLLALLVCWELNYNFRATLHTIDSIYHYESYSAYVERYTANAALVAAARAEDDSFYRMGAAADQSQGLNSPLAFGYPGITHYSSLFNSNLNHLLKSLGFAQGWYWCVYYGSSHLTDALLDIRYVISDRAVPGYEAVAQADGLTLWKNPNTLPLAFLSAETDPDTAASPFALQNTLFSALLGETVEVFTPIQPVIEAGSGSVILTFTGTGQPIYVDLSADGLSELWVDDTYVTALNSYQARHLYCLGAPAPGETLTATVSFSRLPDFSTLCYSCDLDRLADAVGRINSTQVTAVTNSRVDLTVEADSSRTLATTIPAESGWAAYVDGRRVDLSTWLDTFLALELPAGAHAVTLRYTAPGLWPGAVLGLLALLAAALPPLLRRRGRRPSTHGSGF